MDRDEARHRLGTQGWLAGTPDWFRTAILDAARVRHYQTGEVISAIGDPAGGIFGLAEGKIHVLVSANDDELISGHIGYPGTWIGVRCVFNRQPRTTGFVAASRSVVLSVSLPDLDRIIARDVRSWRWLGVLAIDNLETAISAGTALLLGSTRQRFVATFLRFVERAGTGDGPCQVRISQNELASLCNVSRSALAVVLKELQAEGILVRHYGSIEVLDPDRLRRAGILEETDLQDRSAKGGDPAPRQGRARLDADTR